MGKEVIHFLINFRKGQVEDSTRKLVEPFPKMAKIIIEEDNTHATTKNMDLCE